MAKQQPDEVPPELERLLTVPELARLLHVSRTLIYWLIQHGELPAVRIGHALRFRPRDVRTYIRERAAWLPKGRVSNRKA